MASSNSTQGSHADSGGPFGTKGLVVRVAIGLGFLVVSLLIAAFYLRVFSPIRYVAIPEPYRAYEPDAMQTAMRPDSVRAQLDTIMGFGSRYIGQPGTYRAEEYIRRAYQEAGLEIYEHGIKTVAVNTKYRECWLADSVVDNPLGTRLDSVQVYPFLPNYIQPVVTPDTGLVGELVKLDPRTLQTRERFDDCIGVLDNGEGGVDMSYGYAWTRYARLGVKAVIVTHRENLDSTQWQLVAGRFTGMVSDAPVNFVRVAATPNVLQYLGRRVRLRVRAEFDNVPNTVLYGVLRAPEPAREAVLVATRYDVSSILPDKAVNPIQTIYPAVHLQLVKGLAAYRNTLRRDVIFMASGAATMGFDGNNNLIRLLQENERTADSNRLLRALGIKARQAKAGRRMAPVAADLAGCADTMAVLEHLLAVLDEKEFLADAAVTEAVLKGLDRRDREFFRDQYSYVMNSLVRAFNEPKLQAKIAFERLTDINPEGEEFKAYLAAKRVYDEAVSAAGFSPVTLLKSKEEYVAERRVRERVQKRLESLLAYHREDNAKLEQEKALVELFDSYDDIATFHTRLLPTLTEGEAEDVLTLDPGGRANEPALPTIANLLVSASQRLGLIDSFTIIPPGPEQSRLKNVFIDLWTDEPLAMWSHYGYPAYTFVNLNRTETVRQLGYPTDKPAMRNVRSLRKTLVVLGETVVSLAHGNGEIQPVLIDEHRNRSFTGQVLVSNVGQSIVPNFPLQNALVSGKAFAEKAMWGRPGFHDRRFLMTDPYGHYELRHTGGEFMSWWRFGQKGGYSPVAVGYGDDGLVAFMKDEGEDGQRLFKSMNLASGALGNVTIVTFRAAPVTVVDLTNPQTMKDYTSIDLLDVGGLTRFRKRSIFADKGLQMMYLEPDERFYAALQSGAPDNELVKMVRAFMLGIDDPESFESDKEIDGPGYLVADNYFLLDIPRETARSMAWVNGHRLELQNSYSMADEQTNTYHEKTLANLEESTADSQPYASAELKARNAVTYATLNHPVLRESIFEAVMGILWYLGLLVPFAFFFEKLLFCNTDVRKQIAAMSIIFLAVFVLLRTLHPAFHMVRSSLMILLGFIIILISGGLTMLFSGKFQENLEELRKKQGKVAAAEVNRMGVVMSAFMLGLNNMHRRKMRTGLTSATLTLLTFVMICFTSVQNNLVEENVAVGKAPYQGMLVKRERMMPISEAEVFAMKGAYSGRYSVCQRRFLIGRQSWQTKKMTNPLLEAVCEGPGGVSRRYELESAILLNHDDPLQRQLTLLTRPRWFTAEDDLEGGGTCPALIPDKMADELGITVEQVDAGRAQIVVGGTQYRVIGIFDARSLEDIRDLDGRDILPFDLENMPDPVAVNESFTAGDDDPRIPAEKIFITPVRSLFKNVPNSRERVVSMAVVMEGTGYREARQDINTYLEQTGSRVYYGLDGVAYRGRRTRATTMAGIIDLIIPLLIAAMTVLNTMNGSVYERRDEIFVYNAVGIAPRYVFFMFIAEAFVYAVVGSVLGYLLSQGTGRILTILHLTGGLNMTFTSLATIYASVAIAAAVFLSTYYPARSAMEIAAPAEESGWSLPEPEGDELEFDLPFNFTMHGRVAVLAFFDRYLRDNGEGSAGRFFAGVPQMGVEADEDAGGSYVPKIETTIWLKPFDLAVCQRMTIMNPPDPETGQYKARILLERLSGTRESWMRLNQGFVSLVRRHFLHWRAVSDEEREEMFVEARETLKGALKVAAG